MNGGKAPLLLFRLWVGVPGPPDGGADMGTLMLPVPVGTMALSDNPQLPDPEGLVPLDTEYDETGGPEPELG